MENEIYFIPFLLENKKIKLVNSGFECPDELLNENLFDYQKDIVRWALRKGKAALFEDTGLGKTIQQLSWANAVVNYTSGKVLILAPLAVAEQTKKEADKFGIECTVIENEEDINKGINITNYEKLHKFDTSQFIGIVLDESSILKSYSGKTTIEIINLFKDTPYKLACTATPSPNDFTEIGTHSEFLNVMSRVEMLAMFFINDASHGDGWRLKGHSKDGFFRWIAEWAMMIKNPSNLGFDGKKFILPKLNITTHIVKSNQSYKESLFVPLAETLNERRAARKNSLNERVNKVKEIIEEKEINNCLIWCDFNNESELLSKTILNAYEIKGSDTPEHKKNGMLGFADGTISTLISKPSICGFGMNWQHCNNMIFCGLSDSYEQFYQAVRRCYRFGQTKEVNVYIVISDREENVLNNIKKKQENHELMTNLMIEIMSDIAKTNLYAIKKEKTEYKPSIDFFLPDFIKPLKSNLRKEC